MNSKLRDILMDFDTWCLCGKDECVLSENFKEAEKAIRQAVGEEILDYGSWLKPHCSLHEKYTSACCGCQKEVYAMLILADYKDWQRSKITGDKS